MMDDSENSGMVKTGVFGAVFGIAVLLLVVGLFVGSLNTVIKQPDDGEEDHYDRWETGKRWINFISGNLVKFGIIGLFSGTFLLGLVNRDLHPTVRGGLLVAGALMLIAGFRSGFLFW